MERLGRLEIGEDDDEGKGIEVEAGPPPSTAGGEGPSPDRSGDGLLKLIATNPLLAKTANHPEGSVQGRAHLQRMALPQFSGAVEDYWEFREVFHTLVGNTYPEPVLYIHQLKAHITQEGKNIMRGVADITEALRSLEGTTGTRTLRWPVWLVASDTSTPTDQRPMTRWSLWHRRSSRPSLSYTTSRGMTTS